MKSRYSMSATGAVSRRTRGGGVLATLLLSIAGNAAEPEVQWAKAIFTPGYEEAKSLALAPSDQLYLAGDFGQNVLHRFDRDGVLLGSLASRGESIRGVAADSAGNYYLTGVVRDSRLLGIGLTKDFYLAKYSAAGSLIWERTGGASTYSSKTDAGSLGGFKVALDSAGNVFVAGGSTGASEYSGVTFPATTGGPFLGKYSPDGTLLWIKRVEGAYHEYFDSTARYLTLCPDGGIVISGFLYNGEADFGGLSVTVAGPYSSDSFVAKFNDTGEVQWVRMGYGGGGVASDAQGNIYFNGYTAGANSDIHCGKFDANGDLLWERSIVGAFGSAVTLDGKGEPVFSALLYTTVQMDDLLVVYNGYDGSGVHSPEALICKADTAGRFQWAITESGAEGGAFGPLVSDRSGNIYAAGLVWCGYAFGEYYGCTGMLGSFPLEVFRADANNTSDAFIARLFDADAAVPELSITPTAHGLVLSWPAQAANFLPETATSLSASDWVPVDVPPVVSATDRSVELPRSAITCFFRLRSISNE